METKEKKVVFTVLGSSSGVANQSFECGFSPDDVWIRESPGGPIRRWHPVEDFGLSSGESEHYRIDRESGKIFFGDGRKGRIPPAEASISATYKPETVYIPELRARETIVLAGLGKRYSPKYFITRTTHQISSNEYAISFNIRRENEKEEITTISPSFEMNDYFFGKLLTAADFNSEQSYLVNKNRLIDKLIMEYQRESCLISILLRTMKCLGWKMEGSFRVFVSSDERITVEKDLERSSSLLKKVRDVLLKMLFFLN